MNPNRLLAVALLLVLAPPICGGEAADAFHALLEQDWDQRILDNPLFATEVGDSRGADRLPGESLEDHRRRHAHDRAMLERLSEIDPAALDDSDRVNYEIFGRLKRDGIREFEFGAHLMPITNRSGFHVSFAQLHTKVPLRTVDDYDNYIARLRLFKGYVEQYIERMRAGIEGGLVLPAVVMSGWEAAVDAHIVDGPASSVFFKPFAEMPSSFGFADKRRLTVQAQQAILQWVVPGYRLFRRFMAEEYVPALRQEIGASALPRGKAFYEHRVRRYTTLDLSPQQVHGTGLAEVARIRTEMDDVIKHSGFKGSFAEFLAFLRTDKRFYASTAEELMSRVSRVMKRMDGELPRLFKTLPRAPYGIRPVPDYIAPKTTTAYYERPAGDGSRAGFYFVNTYNLPSRPLYEIEALSLHEAVPGHHLQLALQQELEHLPRFRRFTGFTAFIEGWALYAEELGREVGFYEDPYSDFGRLTYEMWRACRLVVDSGIHYFGWTRQQAIDFMKRNAGLSEHNITTEVDRYIAWPGQALAYKIGQLKIRELRELARGALGADFDVREFHDVVLGGGAVPLGVLERTVRSWISAQDVTRTGS